MSAWSRRHPKAQSSAIIDERMRKPMQRIIVSVMLLFSLLCAPAAVFAQQLDKVVVARAFESLLYVPLYVGEAKHIFEKHGLQMDTVLTGSSANSVATLISKSATFSLQDPMTTVLAMQRGAKVKNVAIVIDGVPPKVLVRKDSPIKRIEDLAGKTIATAHVPQTNTYLLQNLLNSRGIKANYLYVPTGTEQAPLMEGKVDAAAMYEPAVDQCIAAGCRILYEFSSALPHGFAFNSIATADDTIATRPELVQRFVDALDECDKAVAADPNAATQIAIERFPQLSPQVVRSAVQRMIREHDYPRSARFTKAAFNAALNVQVQFGNLKPNQIKYSDAVDPSFGLKEAKR
jgi:NitT/TauT family transport system substrate-binding protein